MKFKIPGRGNSGSALMVTLVTASIVGTVLVAYLSMISTQNRSTARSQNWNACIPILEAGVEEALTQLNTNPSNLSADGWSGPYGINVNEYYKLRNINGNYSYAWISNNVKQPIIYSYGYVQVPNSSSWLYRRIRVTTTNEGLFVKSMVAKGQIDMKGNNVQTDSFDSSDPNYSNNGKYDANHRKDNGDVATTSGLTNSLNVGNADIRGHVATGPGGTVAIGSQGIIGDSAFHAAGNLGKIQDGFVSDDMNVVFPNVKAPFSGSGSTPTGGTYDSENYTFALGGGNYSLSSLTMSGQQNMIVTGNAVLYVTGNVSVTGNAYIKIAPGASLKLYVAGSTSQLAGNGVKNDAGNAMNFQYWGLPSNTSVSFSGNAAFTGTVYAPQAALTLGGGGTDVYDFVGASVSNTVQMNGHFKFHYDENLGKMGPPRIFLITSWNEF